MKKYFVCCMIAAMAALLSGCIFSGSPLKFEQFTADLPASAALTDCRVGAVSNISGAGRDFLVRENGSMVKVDRTLRWLNDPAVMLRTALSVVCSGNKVTLSAQLVRFEFSAGLKTLEGAVIFTLKKADIQKTVVCRESIPVVNGDYGRAAAELFERCIKKVSGVKL
ncbi:MAG: hypothetical protein J6R86_06420 [Lentisphaeria bacterium]|nr:hypothetical protein [Lentisphaeria bacterium]